MAKHNQILYQRIDEIIHYLWDPIGISDFPAARDEYKSYLPQIFQLVNSTNDTKKIAHFLEKIANKMSVCSNKKKNHQIAKVMIAWKNYTKNKNQ